MSHLILEKDLLDEIFVLSENFQNVIEFIKQHLFGFDLICDFKSEEELKESFNENPLIEFIIENINSIKYNPNLKNDIISNVIFDKIGENNIFLICIDTLSINKIKRVKPYLFYNQDNLIDFDKFLAQNNNTKILKVSKDQTIPSDLVFQNWTNLDFCFKNINSLIILDNYILSESKSCTLQDNFLSLLDEISKSKYELFLTIITEFKDFEDLNSKYNSINKYIKDNNYKIEINLINHQKHFYPRDFEGFHSRFILSNYYYIISTDSFSYFKPNGKIINSADLIISCNLFKSGNILFRKELKSINEYFKKIVNDDQSPSKLLKLMYHPTKINPLLN